MIEGKLTSEYKSVPTFIQFCKEVRANPPKRKFPVVRVWYPNAYPSVSIETEKFRLRISDQNPCYLEVLDFLESAEGEKKLPCVELVSAEKFAWRLDLLPKEIALWEPLGEHGRTLSVEEQPGNRRKRD